MQTVTWLNIYAPILMYLNMYVWVCVYKYSKNVINIKSTNASTQVHGDLRFLYTRYDNKLLVKSNRIKWFEHLSNKVPYAEYTSMYICTRVYGHVSVGSRWVEHFWFFIVFIFRDYDSNKELDVAVYRKYEHEKVDQL